eukprot:TRINITY_DN25945_c0_g1_i1.p1 TRINITY_DN25945_c0_g1~~TRINITY_DN25945_c0_g1_i1.p1  ORF type:complete len:476 (+),score=83.58 TRINITY_DN25945_c0_g1_i1:168-1595(+)
MAACASGPDLTKPTNGAASANPAAEGSAGAAPVVDSSAAAAPAPNMVNRPHAAVPASQWLVLMTCGLNSALNAYLSMNSSASEQAYIDALHVSEEKISQLYSYFLFTVMIGMTPGMVLTIHYEGLGIGWSVLVNVGSTWLRWLSIKNADYQLCVVSTILNAAGAWTILSLPAQLSKERFDRQYWTLTTSLVVQANYAGWLLGALLPAQLAVDAQSLETTAFAQAWGSSVVLVCFVLFYRKADKSLAYARTHHDNLLHAGSHVSSGANHSIEDGSFRELLQVSIDYPRFAVQVLCCGLLAGISFAQPSVAVFILRAHGFDDSISTWINTSFLVAGVVAGILIGAQCSAKRMFSKTLKTLFVLAAISLVLSAILCHVGFVHGGDTAGFVVMIVLSAVAGAASLGFMGLGIEACALYPASAGYVCWIIEFITQGVGGVLNLYAADSEGFMILAVLSVVAAVAMCVFYKNYEDPDDDEE